MHGVDANGVENGDSASNGDVLWQMNTKFECDGAKTIFFSVQGQKSPLNGVLHLIFPWVLWRS